ncbi:MAG TPA: Mut7-C RNAse domain-containing protein [Candidatus Binatia bacterium]|nr:Mut7-C RNAse domain-containing protein [Candidatus Binatia bacterium]
MKSDPTNLKFAADRMLGRLVKWLRVIGQDVTYGQHLTGYGLIRAARAESRLILTRDRRLKQKQPPPFMFIASDHYREQLRQVIQECGLKPGDGMFTRCVECNTVLQPRSKETVEKIVPPYVFSTQGKFSWCAQCQRVYWPATHHQKMLEELRSIGIG